MIALFSNASSEEMLARLHKELDAELSDHCYSQLEHHASSFLVASKLGMIALVFDRFLLRNAVVYCRLARYFMEVVQFKQSGLHCLKRKTTPSINKNMLDHNRERKVVESSEL